MMNRIQAYEALRVYVKEKQYISGETLEVAVEDFMQSFWGDMDNAQLLAYEGDLEALSALYMRLIQDAISQLNSDFSALNLKILQNNENIRNVIHTFEDGKTAAGIVILNKGCTCYVVGDIHSDDLSLKAVLEKTHFYEKVYFDEPFRLVFLGDYVDRGNAHLKTMERILLLKILFPEQVYLLRGNHDGGKLNPEGVISLPYRIPEKDDPMFYFPRYLEKLVALNASVNPAMIASYLDFFDQLPYIAFISLGSVMIECVHGGLPKPMVYPMLNDTLENAYHFDYLKCLADLTQYDGLDNVGSTICENIMWSDPIRPEDTLDINRKRFNYTQEQFEIYKSKFGIDIMLRGHEVVEDGIRPHFEKQVFTLFSSGVSKTSYYHWVKPKIIRLNSNGKRFEISLYD